jgi:hypothetical protein
VLTAFRKKNKEVLIGEATFFLPLPTEIFQVISNASPTFSS